MERRGFGHTLSVVCPQCLCVLDASQPVLKILQQVEEAQRREPAIPLGTRGKIAGTEWEAIGFQRRQVQQEETYAWNEYLLFHPYRGFRYLTEYNGHWNFVTPIEAMPARLVVARTQPGVWCEGRRFKHFSGAEAETIFVLGEFPWRVKVGEKVVVDDFVAPPVVLSSETTQDEVTWSRGEYTSGADIWKAFGLSGDAPPPRGVFLNQPSPFTGRVGGMWATCGAMILILILLAGFFATFSRQQVVYRDTYRFTTVDQSEPSFVTKVFELDGRTASLELTVDTNLDNNWAFFNFALINDDTGEAFDFGREVSYYYGRDSDGAWTEGSPRSTMLIPSVPVGRYYLRIEPEMEAGAPAGSSLIASRVGNQVNYGITLRHDVPSYAWFWIAAFLLLIPPAIYTMRAKNFETRRWMESDYPPMRGHTSDD